MPGAKDHRVRVTQRLIREAFTGLLKQKPIQSISIKELCEVAGINRGTFYAHYRDIYDLREKIESDMYRDVLGELKPLLDSDAKATQREITTAVFQWMRENRDMCEVVLGEYGDRSFLWKMLDLGRMVCQESYQRMFEGASPRDISWFYAYASWGCIGLLRRWLWEDMETPASEVAGIAEQLIGPGHAVSDRKAERQETLRNPSGEQPFAPRLDGMRGAHLLAAEAGDAALGGHHRLAVFDVNQMHGTGFGATAAADAFGGIHAGQGAAPAEEAVEQPLPERKRSLPTTASGRRKGGLAGTRASPVSTAGSCISPRRRAARTVDGMSPLRPMRRAACSSSA